MSLPRNRDRVLKLAEGDHAEVILPDGQSFRVYVDPGPDNDVWHLDLGGINKAEYDGLIVWVYPRRPGSRATADPNRSCRGERG